MAIDFKEYHSGRSIEIIASGKLTKEDYDTFVPRFDKLIERHGKINVLFVMEDFGGFELWALWEDVKLEYNHYSDIGRLGMSGETAAEQWMANFCKPFSTAEVKIFSSEELEEARAWITDPNSYPENSPQS